ncbi:hypothetical protein OKW22_000958 [Bacilli bacterium PM5-3]|nr:hypothetical protein [Bacilli bacterium PM5-3]MDH6603562.1 hypothetical protein [Bacilli bacterium PM5-9]
MGIYRLIVFGVAIYGKWILEDIGIIEMTFLQTFIIGLIYFLFVYFIDRKLTSYLKSK